MLVKEVMTKNVITIESDKTVFDACNLYKKHKVGSLIVTKKGECVGIITERDIIERSICKKKYPELTSVEEIMTSNIITIHALDTIEKAINLFEEFRIKKLPVIIDEEVVGIITVTDISKVKPELEERFIESWIKSKWKD